MELDFSRVELIEFGSKQPIHMLREIITSCYTTQEMVNSLLWNVPQSTVETLVDDLEEYGFDIPVRCLPTEIWNVIIEKLETERDFSSLSCTCRDFNSTFTVIPDYITINSIEVNEIKNSFPFTNSITCNNINLLLSVAVDNDSKDTFVVIYNKGKFLYNYSEYRDFYYMVLRNLQHSNAIFVAEICEITDIISKTNYYSRELSYLLENISFDYKSKSVFGYRKAETKYRQFAAKNI